MFNNLLSENRAVYEIVWRNNVQPDRTRITIRRVRFACWIAKAKNTQLEYIIPTAFSTATIVMQTLLDVTLYVRCLSVFFFFVGTEGNRRKGLKIICSAAKVLTSKRQSNKTV